jgi:hypothetical protein
MKLSFLFALFVIVLTLNWYKLFDLAVLIQERGPLALGWTVYNWMTDGQASSSPLGWLFIHNFLGILHYFITVFYIIVRSSSLYILLGRSPLDRVFDLSHWTFCLWILPNILRFGRFPWYIALLGNGTPLLIVLLSHDGYRFLRWVGVEVPLRWLWTDLWVYLFGLSMAPLLEVYFLLQR